MLKVITYVIILIGLLIGYVKYIELRSVFFPTREIEFTPGFINLAYEDVYIETEDNLKINAWFIPRINAEYTILFCHGNAGNIGHRLDKIDLLHQMGLNLFIFDYRGYGRSQARPSEKGLYLDAKAAYDYLVNNRMIKSENIILYGESLGSAVVINLASSVKIRALIIEGGFSKGRDMAAKFYPILPRFLFSNKFDSLKKIKEVKAPKLFMHSRDDEIVPIDLAKKLYQAAPEAKYFVEINGGHNSAFLDSKEKYISSIISFIEQL